MARRVRKRPPKYIAQKQLEQELKAGLSELKDTRRTLRDAYDSLLEGNYLKPKTFGKIPRRDYDKMLSIEKKLGVYAPKWKGRKLTPSRKRAIRDHFTQLEYLLAHSTFAPFEQGTSPAGKKKIVRALKTTWPKPPKETARFSGERVGRRQKALATRKGVFVPNSENQLTSGKDKATGLVDRPQTGRLHYDRDTSLWAVKVSRKTKSGLYAQELRYIAGSDALQIKKEKLQRRFDRSYSLKRGQRLRFIIGKNESRRTFRNMEELFRYAARYRQDDAARATFLNELIIEVVSKGNSPRVHWVGKGKRRRRVEDPWTNRHEAFRASNYHDTDPDAVADMLNYEDED